MSLGIRYTVYRVSVSFSQINLVEFKVEFKGIYISIYRISIGILSFSTFYKHITDGNISEFFLLQMILKEIK